MKMTYISLEKSIQNMIHWSHKTHYIFNMRFKTKRKNISRVRSRKYQVHFLTLVKNDNNKISWYGCEFQGYIYAPD